MSAEPQETELETVRYAVSGPVALIALNRPDSLNAFDAALRRDLLDALRRAEQDEAVRVVVLAGEGRAFSAGADLRAGVPGEDVTRVLNEEFKPSIDAIMRSAKPFVAAIHGACAGIGAAYALACDLAVMEEDAYIYQAFAAIGLVPDGGNHWHLVRALGYKRAYQAIVEAPRITAEECLRAGMVNKVVPAGQARAAALEWAARLAQGAPRTLRYAKQILRAAEGGDFETTFRLEAELQALCAGSEDTRNAVAAFFRKEKPVFTGA
ncbi:enoyl-CoA hydratase/isomerase family protein [Oceanicella actignis]|uniref:2-(1,2-epoxy-1,2-dihydrophenyl)acetyl-CoA isomerase n=1 Tax=Oceanicella actignis TaxID=1189325 RepID=A0A1M7TTZ1_9RHOB|nr:enoyl-CoA hydratase-related protein [Oceanicella actignis]TYO90522.1 2-(1,2-epoxy-1,2-dihydrophenyl)acetyl-CoA isomerase [Oceanicella actignis]SES78010.1 short chain enoyl-CoA hydratase /Enoyl-CoA hydratase [Oceanicella actignis]SHN74202.1 2-(1,2-epoxy-1,2-dihydrophenyl)acetyl-CoA isomerase [Oceanicella actignis]